MNLGYVDLLTASRMRSSAGIPVAMPTAMWGAQGTLNGDVRTCMRRLDMMNSTERLQANREVGQQRIYRRVLEFLIKINVIYEFLNFRLASSEGRVGLLKSIDAYRLRPSSPKPNGPGWR